MTARLTPAEARALGLIDTKTKRSKPKLPREGSVTICHTCQERFTTDTAETRHVEETGHARYVLEV